MRNDGKHYLEVIKDDSGAFYWHEYFDGRCLEVCGPFDTQKEAADDARWYNDEVPTLVWPL